MMVLDSPGLSGAMPDHRYFDAFEALRATAERHSSKLPTTRAALILQVLPGFATPDSRFVRNRFRHGRVPTDRDRNSSLVYEPQWPPNRCARCRGCPTARSTAYRVDLGWPGC